MIEKMTPLKPQAHEIFRSIEPELQKIAARYKASDAASQTNSWFARCEEILRGFDEGRFKKLVRIEGQLVSLPDNASPEIQAEFFKSLRRYLAQAFKNELRLASRKDRQISTALDGYTTQSPSGSVETTYIDLLDNVRLSEFIALIKQDLERAQKMVGTAKQQVAYLVLKSVLGYYEILLEKSGDVPIVKDFDGTSVADFFCDEVRGHKTPTIKSVLKKLADSESNEIVKSSVAVLLTADPAYALEQQVARYLQKIPDRLRKKRSHPHPKGTA